MASTSSSPILFYDIASGPPVRPYAPNPWKVRYALNFKQAPFVTEWVELPEVTATRKRLGLDPVRFFANGEPFYTLPVIQDTTNGTLVGDSFDIAVYLEGRFPDGRKLFRRQVDTYRELNKRVDFLFTTGGVLFTDGQPLNPVTAEETRATMCQRCGVKSIEEITVRGEARRRVVDAYLVSLKEVADLFAGEGGPFVGGAEVDYADFVIGGWLMFLKETVAEWEEIRTWYGGVLGRLHDALGPYRGTW